MARKRQSKSGKVTRFAPSPTGHLHLGHAYAALFAAREGGGQCLVRIEDIDQGRCRPEFEAAILEDLEWIGVRFAPEIRRQSEHMEDYQAALAMLERKGLLYPCFCTRAEVRAELAKIDQAPHGPDGPVYPGICRALGEAERAHRMESGVPFALRIDMRQAVATAGPLYWHDVNEGRVAANPLSFGDVVLARKDVPTSYHLAVTVDDHLQGVTLVTRAMDLLPATHIHRLLQALLGYAPPDYHHHRLLTDLTGQRLAKRKGSVSLRELRESGHSPDEVRRMAGFDG